MVYTDICQENYSLSFLVSEALNILNVNSFTKKGEEITLKETQVYEISVPSGSCYCKVCRKVFKSRVINSCLTFGKAYLFLLYVKQGTHRSASLVVMYVHLLAQIATSFADIYKLAGELEAVADVIRAAPPLPVPQARHRDGDVWRPRLVTVVTST